MSVTKKQLADMLTALNAEDKAWVINLLVQQLAGMDSQSKKATKVHHDELSDEQWDAYFNGEPPIPLSEEPLLPKDTLTYTSGRVIKPMQKWL